MLKVLEKHGEAVLLLTEITQIGEFCNEKMYLPYSLYELGESFFLEGKKKKKKKKKKKFLKFTRLSGKLKEAEDCFKRCNKISGYDWEDPLRIRLKVTADQLKKGMSSSKEAPVRDYSF